MCGLCGIAYTDTGRVASDELLIAMRDTLSHRGPDDAGHYLTPGIAIGSRRLAVLDLSERGHMPMSSADGRYRIVYNGEIYNYRELRPSLEARGYRFSSNTDTEVLLYLFIEEGAGMLERLNGMFVFAVWDSRERELFIARDRLGVKPLYYAARPEGLYFASEEKALFAAGVPAQFDGQCWEELLCFRYVAGEQTPFTGIRRLLPGHYLIWRDGNIRITRWWNLSEKASSQRDSSTGDLTVWFRDTFDDSVNLRRISDVPIGVLLSGGLDSGSVAASLALQAGSDLASFTVRFAEAGYDEGPLAKQVAEQWRLDYHELQITPSDLMSRLQQASWLNDEPLAHGNDLYLLAISEYAKQQVTVLLSGEGADETLGGYVRYRPLQHPELLRAASSFLPRLPPVFRSSRRLQKLSRFLALGPIDRFALFNSCDLLPSDLDILSHSANTGFTYRERMLAEAKSLYPGEPVRQAMYSDQHTFLCSILDRNDRMTMGASIECRVPFLDYRLVETLAALPTSKLLSKTQNKRLLRQSVGDRLPEAIRRGRKWGFAVPWRRYFREIPEFRELVANLPGLDPIREGPFIASGLKSAVAGFLAGDDRREPLIRQLVMISVWHQEYFSRLRRMRLRRAEAHQAP
jgi:asparagine synthase (glutamine-hydrolysing)